MAFVLKQSDTYKWPVSVDIPMDGRHKRCTFDGVFKRLSMTRVDELGNQIQKGKITSKKMAHEVLVGWEGIDDDEGNPLEFSVSNLNKLVDVPMVANAISKSFFDSISGVKVKN
tara:strand:- start:244 stop:585 length:342 start_codon:yes stop_codon:yes gene_type:complete